MKVEVAIRTAHLDAVFLKMGQVAPGEEGDRDAGLGQLGSIIHAEGSCADHHGPGFCGQGPVGTCSHVLTLTANFR